MTQPDGLEFKTLAVVNPVEPDTHGVIEALVAVTGIKDEVGDIIEPGAFRRTLGERPKPKVCLGHDWNRPIGKSLGIVELMPGDQRLPKMTADGRPWPKEAGALRARWQANLDSEDGKAAYSNAKFFGPEESTFSIGYRTKRARQRGSTRHIYDLDLYEYGPVLNPANRLATLQSIKSDGELTNPVDSERQDFETGDDAVEAKTKYVRDANYWGKPLGTPITPGMKPRGGNDRSVGVSKKPERTGSVVSDLPDDEQAAVRSMTPDQRVVYLKARANGEEHDDALSKARGDAPALEDKPSERQTSPSAEDDAAAKKPEPKPRPRAPKKPTDKQKTLLFDARPGRIMTYRRDESGNRIYAGSFPSKEGLIFQGHANSAFPMEKAGWVEAGYDGRHYILTPEGERLRAKLESEDAERQTQLREERRTAALGPDAVASADANVVADAAPMDMTSRQYADAEMAAEARRRRARNIAAEETEAAKESDQRMAAEKAATLAPGAIDIDAYRRRTNNPKAELAGDNRLALTGAGTKNWSLSTVDGLGVVRSIDFDELASGGRRKPLGKTQVRDLANRLAGIRDAEGRPAPFDYPNPDPERNTPEWIRGWRDATGADLQSAIAEVTTQWAQDNDLTYRRVGHVRKPAATVPGGAPDSAGFRMRKAEELAPGDQVRLPDGSTGTVERSGADTWRDDREAKKIEGQVLLTDGRTITIYDLGGIEAPKQPEIGTGPNARSNAYVARTRGGNAGPPARDVVVPVKFAEDVDSPTAGHDPGMGSSPATAPPPGREYTPGQFVGSTYVPALAKTYEPLPAGTRVVSNEKESDTFLPQDIRAKVGTALPLVQEFSGETFQTVRLDDGTYDQWRVRGVRGDLGGKGAFEIDPSPERVDQIRRERGLPPVAESTPLRRDAEPGPVEEVKPVVEAPTPPKPAPARPPKVTATEVLPEREALPYEVVAKPDRSGKGGRVRYNGREYSVDATGGVRAQVTVTDDDGHSSTVAGGSTTLLRRDQRTDRERALRQALAQTEAQHASAPESRPEPEAEPPATEPEPPANAEGERRDPADVGVGDRIYGLDNDEVTVTSVSEDNGTYTYGYTDRYGKTTSRHYNRQERVFVLPPETATEETPAVEPEAAAIPVDQIDEAAALQDEVLGIAEQPDGTIEVTEEVAARQDRVAALIEQDDAGTLALSDKSDVELTSTRGELSDELKLQSVLATRQATPKPTVVTSPAGAPEKPPQRPGLAGAAEDYSEALQSGDPEAIARTRARLESSLRRSRAGSESARALADHVTGEGDDDAEQLGAFAQTLRRETRERRNTASRRRRTARRLERVRIQSLIDKIDSELQTRARPTESRQDPDKIQPEFRKRYGGLNDAELEAARLDARERAQTDLSAQTDLRLIRAEMDWREALKQDVAKAPEIAPSSTTPLSDAEYAAHTQRVEAALNAAFAAGQTTDKVHTVNGEGAVWLPERAQAHKDIIDALWAKAANVPRDGEALIAGGLGGAGKSTVLRGGAGVDQSRFLTINPDDVKEEMVRRGLVPAVEGLSPMEASPIVHEESSHIANMLAQRAYAERVNVIWDITMSRQASVAKRIDELNAAGYGSVDAVFVDIPVETSVERALGRHRRGMESFRAGKGAGGRYVPPALIRANASSTSSSANREVFDGLRDRFSSWVVFDNSVAGRDPVKVEGAGRWADTPELTNRVEPTNVALVSNRTTASRPKANADRPRAERAVRVTHQPGDRVQSEYGRGTVIEQTGRSLRYRLDSGEELNVAVGTPGYDRVRPINEADTLAANYLQMHGTAGARAMIERLRGRNRALSAKDQALLLALEALLGTRGVSA